jgi:serine/threonine protein kinase
MPQPDWPLLADFGLVKVAHIEEELTGSDVAVGTPSYMPPEQAGADDVDFRAICIPWA